MTGLAGCVLDGGLICLSSYILLDRVAPNASVMDSYD